VSASANLPCTIKSRSSLPAPAHPGGPGKRAVRRLWCDVVVVKREGTSIVVRTVGAGADLQFPRQTAHR